jgi:hypothetical protein
MAYEKLYTLEHDNHQLRLDVIAYMKATNTLHNEITAMRRKLYNTEDENKVLREALNVAWELGVAKEAVPIVENALKGNEND